MDLHQLQRLKDKADSLQREADKVEGVCERLISELEEELGTRLLKLAKKRLRKLKQQQDEIQAEFDAALADFQQRWGEKL